MTKKRIIKKHLKKLNPMSPMSVIMQRHFDRMEAFMISKEEKTGLAETTKENYIKARSDFWFWYENYIKHGNQS